MCIQTEILQLDVIWLYDHFDRLLLPGGEKLYEEHQQQLHQRWLHRRKLLYEHRHGVESDSKVVQETSKKVKLSAEDDTLTIPIREEESEDRVAVESSIITERVEDSGEWLDLPKLPSITYLH